MTWCILAHTFLVRMQLRLKDKAPKLTLPQAILLLTNHESNCTGINENYVMLQKQQTEFGRTLVMIIPIVNVNRWPVSTGNCRGCNNQHV